MKNIGRADPFVNWGRQRKADVVAPGGAVEDAVPKEGRLKRCWRRLVAASDQVKPPVEPPAARDVTIQLRVAPDGLVSLVDIAGQQCLPVQVWITAKYVNSVGGAQWFRQLLERNAIRARCSSCGATSGRWDDRYENRPEEVPPC